MPDLKRKCSKSASQSDRFVLCFVGHFTSPDPKSRRGAYNYYTHALVSVLVAVVHNIQISSIKPIGQSKPNVMWSILRNG